jgi:biopolymer transport protein ExbB/TolQ
MEIWKKSRPSRSIIMEKVRQYLEKKEFDKAIAHCSAYANCIFCSIVIAGLKFYGKKTNEMEDAINRQITDEIIKLEKKTIVVGVIANIAVYIGLFGTVLGIVNAFHSIALSGSSGLNYVIGGVAEALINTAAGLGVAIPAVVFFNLIMKQIKTLTYEMDSTASELLGILETDRK